MNTQCPHCKANQEVPEVYANKQVKCKKCKQSFTAAQNDTLTNPKTITPSDKNKNNKPHISFWRPGIYLQALGCLGIIASFLFSFSSGSSLGFEAAINHIHRGATSFSEAEVFLIETLISGITLLGILLSLVLIGLGSVVKNLQKK